MNRTDLEQQAFESTLTPLSDYVVNVGLEKNIAQYTKVEILGLVETILNAYHHNLQTLYKNEIPF